MNVHVSDGLREPHGICPNCDRASHPASRIGLCRPCFLATYRDAVQLINTTDGADAMRRERDDHSALVQPGRAMSGKPGWVYFYRQGNRVKIGWSSDPSSRVKSFGDGSLLGTIPGYLADERALHEKFDLLRLDGEWFAYTPALARYVSDLAAEAA